MDLKTLASFQGPNAYIKLADEAGGSGRISLMHLVSRRLETPTARPPRVAPATKSIFGNTNTQ